MTTCHVLRARLFMGVLIAVSAAGACGRRDDAAAPAPDAATATTTTTTSTTTTTTTLPPPPVWRGARWGMTPEEVLAAFAGQAQRPAEPPSFVLGPPGVAEVVVPAHDEDGAKFRVLFGFAGSGSRLGRIQLAAARAQPETCYDVEQRLVGEHGEPSSRRDAATSVQTREVAWTLPAQTITLTCVDKPSLGFRTVTLDYAAAADRTTN